MHQTLPDCPSNNQTQPALPASNQETAPHTAMSSSTIPSINSSSPPSIHSSTAPSIRSTTSSGSSIRGRFASFFRSKNPSSPKQATPSSGSAPAPARRATQWPPGPSVSQLPWESQDPPPDRRVRIGPTEFAFVPFLGHDFPSSQRRFSESSFTSNASASSTNTRFKCNFESETGYVRWTGDDGVTVFLPPRVKPGDDPRR